MYREKMDEKIQVRVTLGLKERIHQVAEMRKETPAEIIRTAIASYLYWLISTGGYDGTEDPDS